MSWWFKMKWSHRVATVGLALILMFGGLWCAVEPTPDPVHAGKHASEWLRELDCGDPLREQEATNAFVALGTNALPLLKATLNRRDSHARQLLLRLQEKFPSLGVHWHSISGPWRERALTAAVVLGTNALPILPEVIDAMVDPRIGSDPYAQVEFLADFGRAGVMPITEALTNCGSMHSERALLESLNLILASNQLSLAEQELVITTLTTVLQDNWDEFVDREAAYALGRLGAKAERAIPVLLGCVTNREPKSSYAAAWALGQINRQPEVVLPALVQVTDPKWFCTVRAGAVEAMGQFGTDALHLIPLLMKLSADRDAEVRCAALSALVQLAPASKRATAAVVRQMHDRNSYLRQQAVKASVLLTGAPWRLIAALEKSLKDNNEEVRREAEVALKLIRAREQKAIHTLRTTKPI